jgi:hypothetical protein
VPLVQRVPQVPQVPQESLLRHLNQNKLLEKEALYYNDAALLSLNNKTKNYECLVESYVWSFQQKRM